MSNSTLKSLTIEHLRGSVVPFALPFDKNKKLTVIYGENGTGKSTICDAFEFLGKGRVGSLENRGLGKTGRYWYSVGKTAADVSVTIETHDSTCVGKIHKSEVVCLPSEARPRVEVLRRGQILSLVEASPGDRYAAISRFIDVSGAEASEASLRSLITDLQRNREVAVARVQENQEAVGQFWETAGSPGVGAFVWADSECNRDTKVDEEQAQALSLLGIAFGRLADIPSRLESAGNGVTNARALAEAAIAEEGKVAATAASGAGDVIEVLQVARTFLHRHPKSETCPVCESAENIEGLPAKIAQRLETFAALQHAQTATRAAGQGVQRAEQQFQVALDEAQRVTAEFEVCRAKYEWPADIKLPAEIPPAEGAQLKAWLEVNQNLPAEWKKAEAIRQDRKQFLRTLREAVKTCRDNTAAQKELDALLPRLARTLEIVAEERRLFTDDILSKIAACVGELYEAVHPGEGLNKITLELDPKKRASLEIGTDFCGETGAPPQAYFSESHLDTLGLCVFLAMAQMDQPEITILVLDDVLASVDEPHVERLIEMLHAQALKFRHCVITTHYRPWKMKLRWGWLKNGQCHFIELSRWTSDAGLTLIRTVPDLHKLRTLLDESPPDAQLVCAKAGFILEAALNFITLHYECKVSRKSEDRYTLGDLLPAIDKKLKAALNIERKTGTDETGTAVFDKVCLTPIIEELHRIAQARNVFGCHFNALSFELLDTDALLFGRKVLELMECLTDEEGGWPRNGKSGVYWTTSGDTRRLTPYKRPE